MERRRVAIDTIHIGSRHREADMAKVKEIAKSVSEIGLLNPPAVTFRNGIIIDGEEVDNVAVLIYGRHRLLALQELGEVAVECIVHDIDDLHAELMEIDENLARAELSPAQEAAHIRRRQEIWEEMHGSAKAIGGRASAKAQGKEVATEKSSVAFTKETAQTSGKDERSIRQAARRGKELGPDIHRIAGTSLDKGVEMDALIKLPEPERKSLIERASKGEAVSARPPAPPKPLAADRALEVMATDIIESADQPATFADIKRVWDRAERADQQAFLEWAHKNVKSAAQDDFDPSKLWLAHG